MNETAKEAKYWHDLGIAPIPILYKGKQPFIKWAAYCETLPSEAFMERWFYGERVNLAVITGWHNLVVIDFDENEAYEKWMKWALWQGGTARLIAEQTRLESSSRGMHLFCFTKEPAENAKLPGIDILARRKYCVVAPSVHPTGRKYRLIRDVLPLTVERIEDCFPEGSFPRKRTELPPMGQNGAVKGLSGVKGLPPNRVWVNTPAEAAILRSRRIEDLFPEKRRREYPWLTVRCPLHDDQHPSAWINTEKQIFGCRVCTEHPMNVIDLYARMKGISRKEAVRQLQ